MPWSSAIITLIASLRQRLRLHRPHDRTSDRHAEPYARPDARPRLDSNVPAHEQRALAHARQAEPVHASVEGEAAAVVANAQLDGVALARSRCTSTVLAPEWRAAFDIASWATR